MQGNSLHVKQPALEESSLSFGKRMTVLLLEQKLKLSIDSDSNASLLWWKPVYSSHGEKLTSAELRNVEY
jgi:hypothetical protein